MRWFLSVLLVLFVCAPVQAADLAGVQLPDTVKQGEKKLQLNGIAIRKATIFGIHVYVMGLYLEEPGTDAAAIVASEQDKRIVIKFVRSVGAAKLQDAWVEGFEDNYGDYSAFKEQVNALVEAMVDVEEDDSIEFRFVGDTVRISVNNDKSLMLEGREFQKGLLLIWLGENPPNAAMKTDLLNGSVVKRKGLS